MFGVDLPLAAPPPGVTPNFDHPESRLYQAHIGLGLCMGVTFVVLVLRCYAKWRVMRSWMMEDYACVLGFALTASYIGLTFFLMRPGGMNSTHIWELRMSNSSIKDLSVNVACTSLYSAATLVVKFSLFLVYLRLFKPNKISKWLICSGIMICGVFYMSCILAYCVICIPPPSQRHDLTGWTGHLEKCHSKSVDLALVQLAFGTASDTYMLVIPIYSIFQLQLPFRKKIGVSAIFLVGLIAIGCSIMNLVYRIRLKHVTDTNWFAYYVYQFSVGEIAAGIICSCMPILPSLFRHRSNPFKRISWHASFSPRYWWRRASSPSSHSNRPFVQPKSQNKAFQTLHLGWTQDPRSGLWTEMGSEEGPQTQGEKGDDHKGFGVSWLRLDEEAISGTENRA